MELSEKLLSEKLSEFEHLINFVGLTESQFKIVQEQMKEITLRILSREEVVDAIVSDIDKIIKRIKIVESINSTLDIQ